MKTEESLIDLIKIEFSDSGKFFQDEMIEFHIGDISIPHGSTFRERNPSTGVEIWNKAAEVIIKSERVIVIRNQDKTSIVFDEAADYSVKYGVLRSELTNMYRSKMARSKACSVHAACVNLNHKNLLIIGNKGTGKSSSSLYLHLQGGHILTDEMVFFDDDERLTCLPRFIGLDHYTLDRYFPQYKPKVKASINSMYNTEQKVLLDIMTKPNGEIWLDQVIVIVKGESRFASGLDIVNLISEQWNSYDNGKRSEGILRKVISLATPMTLNQISEMSGIG